MQKHIGGAVGLAVLAAVGIFFYSSRAWSVSLEAPVYRQKGSDKASLVIMEFSDFQCPNCAKVQGTVNEIMKRNEGKILLVFRHMPLKSHQWSRLAARAAEAAGAQGKFWEYHDMLFEGQKSWANTIDPKPVFIHYAEKAGLNMKKFQEDLNSDRFDAIIQRDVDQASARAVSVTPTFFIGSTRLVGQSQLEAYGDQTVQQELNRK